MSIACTGASRKNTMVRMSSSSSSPDQNFKSFFSEVGEQIANHKRQFMESIKNFQLNVESLKKSLKLLNAKASDVKDQIKSLEGSGGKKRKREIEEWLTQVKSIENEVFELGTKAKSEGFITNLMDGGKVEELHEEVIMLVEQSQHFDEFLLNTCGTRGVEFLTTEMVGDAFVDNVKRIWSLLETKKVSSIGIHGMGGVGKTAMAKCINNLLLKLSQVSVFWIGVSDEFTLKSLQEKIACLVGLDLSDECDIDVRSVKLHQALSQLKNSVLILDGLWEYIDLSKVGCPISAECCRLIITTRSLEVCHQICCQRIIEVKTLCENEAWSLFTESLISPEKIEQIPRVEEIAKSVAKLCGGLPLGIINVAESMRGKTSIHSWTVALQELNEHVTRQGGIGALEVFRVLKHSFDRLNNQSEEFNTFQLCFLHCSFYPQGRDLYKDVLVDLLISNGLLDGRMSRRAQIHQAQSVLDKLVNVCLLETDGLTVKMHGLVRGMALKIGERKYMVSSGVPSLKEIPREEEWAEGLEKVALMENGIESIQDGTSPNCPKLSTLLLEFNPLKAIPDSFFSKMKRLSTLDLRVTDITALPDSVSDLTSLTALLLSGCEKLEKVPYLGKLKALRELKLCFTAIVEVPPGVEELLNLEFLSLEGVDVEMLPGELLLKLRHLQYLNLPLKVQVTAEEIENLKELEQFCGRLKDVSAFNSFITNQQGDALFQGVIGGEYTYGADEGCGDYDREVYLFKCNLKDEKVLCPEIESLTIEECNGLSKCLSDDLSPFQYSKSLRLLTIRRCKGIEYVLTCSRESPSSLQVIDLEALDDFKGLVAAPPARTLFSVLRRLYLSQCNKVTKMGLHAWGVPYIEEIVISDCERIEEVFEDKGRGSVVLPNLKELKLVRLPSLRTVYEAKMICDSITAICIAGCPNLTKKFPVHLGVPPPPALRTQVEEEWWKSLEWENPNLPLFLKPTFLLK